MMSDDERDLVAVVDVWETIAREVGRYPDLRPLGPAMIASIGEILVSRAVRLIALGAAMGARLEQRSDAEAARLLAEVRASVRTSDGD